jgi:hypothetical protein
MPNLRVHCKKSKERIGKDYEELHKWMDEGQKYLEKDHRFERHSGSYIDYVMKTWGKDGVIEFLNHIIDDFKDTLSKYTGICEKCGKDTYRGMKLCRNCYREKLKKT